MPELRDNAPGTTETIAGPELIPSEYLQKWQSLVTLMAELCEVPAGLIMRVWPAQIEVLVSSSTPDNPYSAHHKADLGTGLYCETVMKSGQPLLVPNALEDADWNRNPDLELGMVAYLGIPLYWREQELFGTICVLDGKTRKFASRYLDLLWHFKGIIENDCRLIQRTRALEAEQARAQAVSLRRERQARNFFESFPGMAMFVSDAGRCLVVNQRGCQLVGRSADAICGGHLREVLTEAGWATVAQLVGRAANGEAIIEDVALPLLRGYRRVQLMCVPHDDATTGVKGMYLFGVDQEAQKAAEEALTLSESRLQAAQAMAHLGMWELDLVENRLVWSDETFRIFELDRTRAEASYDAFLNGIHPDDRVWVDTVFRRSVETRTPYEIVHRLQMPDGRIKYVQCRGETFYDGEGRPQRAMGMVQDITDRKQVEEALRISQQRFALAVQGSQTGIWDWDIQANQAYFSPLWKQQLGYEDQELPSLPEEWYGRQHPDDRARVAETLRAYLAGETTRYELEHRLRHKDGSYRWILARGVVLHDAQGKPSRMAGSHVDITDRKRMELALIESEERFNYVAEATNEGIWDWDIQTGRAYFSPQWLRLLEYVPEEAPPSVQFFFDMLHPDDAARMTPVLQAHMDGHLPVMELELRLRNKSEAYRWFLDRGKVVTRSQDGTPLRMVGTITDITDRRQAEQALRLTRFSIEHAVDAVLWVDVSARILDVNEAACTMLGYPREELLSKTIHDITPNMGVEEWRVHWEDVKARTSFSFESDGRKKNGTVIRIEMTVNFLIHEEQEYNCVFIRDITESKRAQSRLRATQYAIDHATDSLFVINMNGQFVDVNESACSGLGYTKEELLTKTVMDIDPDWSLRDLQTFWEKFRSTKTVTRIETRHRTKSGVIYPVEVVANFILHEGQELNYAFVRDISARKKAEAFAEAQRTVLSLIVKHAPLTDILACLCLETEKQSDGMLCSVLLLEGTTLRHAVAPSLPDEYTRAIDGVTIGPAVGSCGAAAYKNETVIVADIATDPLWADYKAIALRQGLKTCWSTPICDAAGSVLGVFAVYRRTPVAPDAAQEALINMSVYLGGIAIERRRAEEALQLVKFTVDHATDAIYWVGSGAELLDVNETACAMLGYTKEEFSRMTLHDINPNLEKASWPISWERTSRRGTMSIETTHRTKDGRLIPVEVRVNVLNYHGVECHCGFVRDITTRKLAEEELRRSEELFRVAYRNAAVGMALCDLRGRFLEINPAFCEILGYSEGELRERDFKAVTYPDDIPDSVNRVRELVEGKILQHLFEKRYVRKNGEIVWAHAGISVIRDATGVVANILAMVQDITDRKNAEMVLRASERRLIEAQSMARLGSWSWDFPADRHQWSDEQYRILGREPRSIQPAFEVFINSVHPDDRDMVVGAVTAAIDRDMPFDLTCRIVRPDGMIRYVYCRGEVMRNKLGLPVSMSGTIQDNTRQKRTEEMLRVVATDSDLSGETKFFWSMLRTLAEGTGAIYAFCGKLLPGGQRVRMVAAWNRGSEDENVEYDMIGTPCQLVVDNRICVYESGVQEKFPSDRMLQVLGVDWYFGVPLFGSDEQPIGLLAVMGTQPFEDTEHVKTLLQICAGRAGSELERRQIEGVLRSSEERFRLVAEATQDVLWDWNVITGEHWWSPNARARFGDDIHHSTSYDAWVARLHPDDRARVLKGMERALVSEDRTVTDEYRFQLADGSYGYFYDRGQIVRDAAGRPIRIIGAMIDVTLSKRAYASLEDAYQRLRCMSRELQAVESNERRRLSRELHDEVGQVLAGLKFDLGAIRQALSNKDKVDVARALERILRALETTDELFERLRRIVRALRPSVLEELGLKEAVKAMISEIQSRSNLVCSVSVDVDDAEGSADLTIETALYRMTQELVTNVVRHARAMTMSVSLAEDDREWTLVVQDDGVGFNPQGEFISGIGIRGIRERAEIFGGRVDICSASGAGTTVMVWIPVTALAWTDTPPMDGDFGAHSAQKGV